MTHPTPLEFRRREQTDPAAFAAFRCSTGTDYAEETERFVRRSVLPFDQAKHADATWLMAVRDGALVGVAAYKPGLLPMPDAVEPAVYLLVVAVDVRSQRRGIGRALMGEALVAAGAAHPDRPYVFALVADDNGPSHAMCEHHGLRSTYRHSPGLIGRVGWLHDASRGG